MTQTTGIDCIVALNTFSHFLKADMMHNVYFNSPDISYFDGSASGYWRRKAFELGATEAELAEIESELKSQQIVNAIARHGAVDCRRIGKNREH